jgi:hypothetical protein
MPSLTLFRSTFRPLAPDRRTAAAGLACAVALAASAPAQAVHMSQIALTGEVYTSLDNGVTKTPNVVRIVTNPNGSKSATQTGGQSDSFTFGPGLSQAFAGSAAAEATAFADFGVLRINASASALASPTAYVAPFPGALGNNPYESVARSAFSVAFQDNFTLTDPAGALPIGTPVSYRVSVVLDSIVGGDFSGNLQIAAGLLSNPTVGGTFIRSSSFQFSFGDHFVFGADVDGRIGETHVFAVSLVAGANAYAGFARSRESQSSFFNAGNTLHGNLDPVTQGLVLVTESGHDYRTVPEPGSFALASCGLTGLAWLSRRRGSRLAR